MVLLVFKLSSNVFLLPPCISNPVAINLSYSSFISAFSSLRIFIFSLSASVFTGFLLIASVSTLFSSNFFLNSLVSLYILFLPELSITPFLSRVYLPFSSQSFCSANSFFSSTFLTTCLCTVLPTDSSAVVIFVPIPFVASIPGVPSFPKLSTIVPRLPIPWVCKPLKPDAR